MGARERKEMDMTKTETTRRINVDTNATGHPFHPGSQEKDRNRQSTYHLHRLLGAVCDFIDKKTGEEEYRMSFFEELILEVVDIAHLIGFQGDSNMDLCRDYLLTEKGVECIYPLCGGTMKLNENALLCGECCRIISKDLYKIFIEFRNKDRK